MASSQKGLLGMFNMFSEVSNKNGHICSWNHAIYSSSIIVQLLTGTSDYFKNLKDQGEMGRKK